MIKSVQQKGFTIVELLIVIVVIGILAAITVVSYNGVQQRANAATVTSTLTNVAKKMSVDYTLTGSYALTASAVDENRGLQTGSKVSLQYTSTGSTYCITGTTAALSYKISNTNQTPVAGGCAGHGIGGVDAITNIIANPGFENGTTGWNTSGITAASAPDWFQSGSNSVKLTNTSTADTGDMRLSGGFAAGFPSGITAGGTYTISATLRMTAPLSGGHNRAPRVMYFYSTNGSAFTESFGPKANNVAGIQTISHTFTVPANATGVVLGLGGSSSVIGDAVYYDNVIMTSGSTVYNYADGGSTDWVWNGTPNNSTSTGPGL